MILMLHPIDFWNLGRDLAGSQVSSRKNAATNGHLQFTFKFHGRLAKATSMGFVQKQWDGFNYQKGVQYWPTQLRYIHIYMHVHIIYCIYTCIYIRLYTHYISYCISSILMFIVKSKHGDCTNNNIFGHFGIALVGDGSI